MLILRVESFYVIFVGENWATTFRASGEAVYQGDSVNLTRTVRLSWAGYQEFCKQLHARTAHNMAFRALTIWKSTIHILYRCIPIGLGLTMWVRTSMVWFLLYARTKNASGYSADRISGHCPAQYLPDLTSQISVLICRRLFYTETKKILSSLKH